MKYAKIFEAALHFECSKEEIEGFEGFVHLLPDAGFAGETIVYVPSREMFMVYMSHPLQAEDAVHYYTKDGTLLHAKSVNPVMEAIIALSKLDESEFMTKKYEAV